MTLILPTPIAAYYAGKNKHDIDAMLAPFAADAIVHDEGATHKGANAVRAWMEDTTRKYRVTATPEEVSNAGDETVVRALVAGDFPGSPAHLTYRFKLKDERIAGLSIG